MVAACRSCSIPLDPVSEREQPCLRYSDLAGRPVIRFDHPLHQESDDTPDLLLALRELVETCGWSRVLIDLSNLEWNDGDGVNGLLLVQSVLEKCRVRSVYFGLPPRVQQQLATSRLNRVLMIAAGPADAVRQLGGCL